MTKRAALLLLLALSACGENLPHSQPPMDHFFFPSGLALSPVAGGNQALLVASANYDLRYDQEVGGTVLSVDPSLADNASGTGGSLGRSGGALVKHGPGAQMGSFAGPLVLANAASCPGLAGAEAWSASRYTGDVYRTPVGTDGWVEPCRDPARPCRVQTDQRFDDPAALAVACRADGARRSLFVGYLRSPTVGIYPYGTAWLTEFNLTDPSRPRRTFPMVAGPIGDMAYDALTDRLYAVGRFAGATAPLFILDLPPCSLADPPVTADCPDPRYQVVELSGALGGAELVGIALSNPRPGRLRRAYLSVRVYDSGYAAAIRARPPFDVGGAIMVVELEDDVMGRASARVIRVVPIGIGAGPIRVLPPRPGGLRDLVVVPCSADGSVQVYDDEAGAVVRVITADELTGAPEAGHVPAAMAVEDRGAEAYVYLASFKDWTVSVLRVPLLDPTSADLLRASAAPNVLGSPLRIGSTPQ